MDKLSSIIDFYRIPHEKNLLHSVKLSGQNINLYRIETPEVVYIDRIIYKGEVASIETSEFAPNLEPDFIELEVFLKGPIL